MKRLVGIPFELHGPHRKEMEADKQENTVEAAGHLERSDDNLTAHFLAVPAI